MYYSLKKSVIPWTHTDFISWSIEVKVSSKCNISNHFKRNEVKESIVYKQGKILYCSLGFLKHLIWPLAQVLPRKDSFLLLPFRNFGFELPLLWPTSRILCTIFFCGNEVDFLDCSSSRGPGLKSTSTVPGTCFTIGSTVSSSFPSSSSCLIGVRRQDSNLNIFIYRFLVLYEI